MRAHLVGADCEENLGLCMVAAVAEGAGHQVEIVPYNDVSHQDAVVAHILRDAPQVVGLSVQFQHRAHSFLDLARTLRRKGYRGHITCGGQFPTMAWREVLSDGWGVSSVVLHEAEYTFVELLAALASDRPLSGIDGLALNGPAGPYRTAHRRPEDELDRLPLARRYRPHTLHVGVPFIPIMGSRGCWGRCSYCSISTLYRDARARGGARLIRHRSPQNIAEEMALLAHGAGGSAVFCFHDDNFLMPRPEHSLRRVRAIREAVDAYGVGTIGFIGKCRPDSVTPELARELRALGVVRLFVGVENVSQAGSDHLGRGVQVEQVHRALEAIRAAGIFGCYNLLLFERHATLADVRQNLAFIRAHASQPVNFCRVEPYSGTPLQQQLAAEGNLSGSYLGYDYRIADDRVEALFRICAAVFRERNFAPAGVHNRYMGLGYLVSLLDRFYDDPAGVAVLARESEALTRAIALETADFLEEAVRIVADGSLGFDRIERETGGLGLAVADADRRRHVELDTLYAALYGFAGSTPRVAAAPPRPGPRLAQLARRVATGVSVGLWLAATAVGCDKDRVVTDSGTDAGADVMVVDPLPSDVGVDVWTWDPVPPDVGVDIWPVDPAPMDSGADLGLPDLDLAEDAMAMQFRSTTPERVERSRDLPLYYPPAVTLEARREGGALRVSLRGGPEAISTRWQSQGEIDGDGREVLWRPADDDDQISVGIRSAGGVALVSLRARKA